MTKLGEIQGPVLNGPIPWLWLAAAARLPGRALHVGLYLWFVAELRSTRKVTVVTRRMAPLGLDRFAVARGINSLEKAGLIEVRRHRGRGPIVLLLAEPSQPAGQE